MAQVSLTTLRQYEGLNKLIAAMMQEMLDDIIADCESDKQIAAEIWLEDCSSEYATRYGKGEIAAYDTVIKNLEKWKLSLEDDVTHLSEYR